MEAQLKKALLMRGTLYRDIQDDIVSYLVTMGEVHGMDAKTLAGKLDRFMTVSRCVFLQPSGNLNASPHQSRPPLQA